MTIDKFINSVNTNIINPIIGIIFAFAFVLFIWGVAKYMMNAENDNDRTQGKNHIIYGLIGMFIAVSVMGIIGLINNALGN